MRKTWNWIVLGGLMAAPVAMGEETKTPSTQPAAGESAGWWFEQALVQLRNEDHITSHVIEQFDRMDITFDTVINAMIGAGEFERALKIARERAPSLVEKIEAAMKQAKPNTRDHANEAAEKPDALKQLRELWKDPKGREEYEKQVREWVEAAKKIEPRIDILGRDRSGRNAALVDISLRQQEVGDFEGAYKTMGLIENAESIQSPDKEKRAYVVGCKTREFIYKGRMKELKEWLEGLFSEQDRARACLIVGEELASKGK